MKAQVGDQLIREGRRVCEIIALQHADGSPPYVVRWLSDGHIALLYPGPYMRLSARRADRPPDGASRHADAGQAAARQAPAAGHQDRCDAGRAKGRRKTRAPWAATGRHWQASPFTPRALAIPWPCSGLT